MLLGKTYPERLRVVPQQATEISETIVDGIKDGTKMMTANDTLHLQDEDDIETGIEKMIDLLAGAEVEARSEVVHRNWEDNQQRKS